MGREHISAIVGDWSLLRGKERRAVREGWVELGGRPPGSSQITKSQGRKISLGCLSITGLPESSMISLG